MAFERSAHESGKSLEQEICEIMRKTNALEFGAFRLSSGRVTPYYVDLRVIPSFPDTLHKISDIFIDAVRRDLGTESFDRISGIPIAGTPFASIVAFHLNKPFLYTRGKPRLRGRERRVEGVLMPGDRVLLIDDLATTGLSLEKGATAIRAEGGVVTDAFVLLEREEGAEKRLAEIDVNLHSVLKMSKAARRLYEMNAIDEDQLEMILRQVRR
jgi:orotate phosphoribosyltransferase